MSFVTYHPSNKQLGHFIGREAVFCNLNSNVVEAGVEGVGCLVASWVVKQSTYVLLRLFGGRLSKADEIGM